MLGNLFGRKELLTILLAAGVLILCVSVAQARDPMSLHVLFTGNVSGRMEPSG